MRHVPLQQGVSDAWQPAHGARTELMSSVVP